MCSHGFALAVTDKDFRKTCLQCIEHKLDSVLGFVMYDIVFFVVGYDA